MKLGDQSKVKIPGEHTAYVLPCRSDSNPKRHGVSNTLGTCEMTLVSLQEERPGIEELRCESGCVIVLTSGRWECV